MKKLISFRTFQRHCGEYDREFCVICKITRKECTEKNCPVWKHLKSVKDYIIDKAMKQGAKDERD